MQLHIGQVEFLRRLYLNIYLVLKTGLENAHKYQSPDSTTFVTLNNDRLFETI